MSRFNNPTRALAVAWLPFRSNARTPSKQVWYRSVSLMCCLATSSSVRWHVWLARGLRITDDKALVLLISIESCEPAGSDFSSKTAHVSSKSHTVWASESIIKVLEVKPAGARTFEGILAGRSTSETYVTPMISSWPTFDGGCLA